VVRLGEDKEAEEEREPGGAEEVCHDQQRLAPLRADVAERARRHEERVEHEQH
jgi:hypothetical protein